MCYDTGMEQTCQMLAIRQPDTADTDKWNEFLPCLNEMISLLQSHNVAVHGNSRERWLLDLTIDGVDGSIHFNNLRNLSVREFQAFLSVLNDYMKTVKDSIQGATRRDYNYHNFVGDIFYSDIYYALKPYKGYKSHQLMYQLMCSMLQRARIWVHS